MGPGTLGVEMRAKPITKAGAYGPLYRYTIEYDDGPNDPGYPVTTWSCWAYTAEHALEKFAEGGEGYRALRYTRQTEAAPYSWVWHKA